MPFTNIFNLRLTYPTLKRRASSSSSHLQSNAQSPAPEKKQAINGNSSPRSKASRTKSSVKAKLPAIEERARIGPPLRQMSQYECDILGLRERQREVLDGYYDRTATTTTTPSENVNGQESEEPKGKFQEAAAKGATVVNVEERGGQEDADAIMKQKQKEKWCVQLESSACQRPPANTLTETLAKPTIAEPPESNYWRPPRTNKWTREQRAKYGDNLDSWTSTSSSNENTSRSTPGPKSRRSKHRQAWTAKQHQSETEDGSSANSSRSSSSISSKSNTNTTIVVNPGITTVVQQNEQQAVTSIHCQFKPQLCPCSRVDTLMMKPDLDNTYIAPELDRSPTHGDENGITRFRRKNLAQKEEVLRDRGIEEGKWEDPFLDDERHLTFRHKRTQNEGGEWKMKCSIKFRGDMGRKWEGLVRLGSRDGREGNGLVALKEEEGKDGVEQTGAVGRLVRDSRAFDGQGKFIWGRKKDDGGKGRNGEKSLKMLAREGLKELGEEE